MQSIKSILFLTTVIFGSCTIFNDSSSSELQWVEVPSGERQCIPPNYTSLENATGQLSSNDINVFDSNTITFAVCAACSCPTGIIYQAQIKRTDLERAEALGWSKMDSGDN